MSGMPKTEMVDSVLAPSTVKALTATAVGGGLAAGPAMVDVPFYESNIWLSSVAILGITVLSLAAINSLITLRRNIRSK